MFVGTNKLVLNEETMREAVQEYLNRRTSSPLQHMRVLDLWYLDADNEYQVTVAPKSEDN